MTRCMKTGNRSAMHLSVSNKFCSFPTEVATLSADRFGVLKLFAETASLIHRWSEALHEKTVEDC